MKHKLESLRWRFKFWYATYEGYMKAMAVSFVLFFGGLSIITMLLMDMLLLRLSLVCLFSFVYVFAFHARVCNYVYEHRRVKYTLQVSETFVLINELHKMGWKVVRL